MYVVLGLATLCAISALLGAAHLIDFFWPLMAVTWGGLLLGGVWFVMSIIGAVSYRRVAGTILTPVIFFSAVGALLLGGVPQSAQHAISQSALDQVASECTPATDIRVGLYRVESVQRLDDACLLFLPGGFLDKVGLGKFPSGVPAAQSSSLEITPYRDGWFSFIQYF